MPPHLPISLSYLRLVTDLRTPVNAILENISKYFAIERSMVVMYSIMILHRVMAALSLIRSILR